MYSAEAPRGLAVVCPWFITALGIKKVKVTLFKGPLWLCASSGNALMGCQFFFVHINLLPQRMPYLMGWGSFLVWGFFGPHLQIKDVVPRPGCSLCHSSDNTGSLTC